MLADGNRLSVCRVRSRGGVLIWAGPASGMRVRSPYFIFCCYSSFLFLFFFCFLSVPKPPTSSPFVSSVLDPQLLFLRLFLQFVLDCKVPQKLDLHCSRGRPQTDSTHSLFSCFFLISNDSYNCNCNKIDNSLQLFELVGIKMTKKLAGCVELVGDETSIQSHSREICRQAI